MNVLVIGDEREYHECRLKFGDKHAYSHAPSHAVGSRFLKESDVTFDFAAAEVSAPIPFYTEMKSPLFVDTSLVNLKEINRRHGLSEPVNRFGFAGLPTFLNREILEVAIGSAASEAALTDVCGRLMTPFQIVADRVGLVTPRVICMIINEAYSTFQDGTATREDIDLAMKLGTHYPYGPFEWCQKIGVIKVKQLLEAVHTDTGDSRYVVCPALASELD